MMIEAARLKQYMKATVISTAPEAMLHFRYDGLNRQPIDASAIDVAVAVAG
ncbi:MAG: hypothetical protein PVF35_07050 [Gammaproteobacteria bacterium]|jgi:hypothetical protein